MDADEVDRGIYQSLRAAAGGLLRTTIFKYPDDSVDSVYVMLAHAFWHWQRRPQEQRAADMRTTSLSSRCWPRQRWTIACASAGMASVSAASAAAVFLPLGLSGTFASKWTWSLPNPIRMGNDLWIYYFGDNQDHDGFIDPAASSAGWPLIGRSCGLTALYPPMRPTPAVNS